MKNLGLIKVSISLFVVIILSQSCYPQQTDSLYNLLTKQRDFEWIDIVRNARSQIVDYYDRGFTDSADIIINFVESKYKVYEFGAYKLMRNIETGEFATAPCDSNLIYTMIYGRLGYYTAGYYHPYGDSLEDLFYRQRSNLASETNVGKYNQLIINMADSLRQVTRPYSDEHAICQSLSSDYVALFPDLLKGRYSNTCLGTCYMNDLEYVAHEMARYMLNYALGMGSYVTSGSADIIKPGFYMDLLVGTKWGKYGFDIGLGFNGGAAKTDFPLEFGAALDTPKTVAGVHFFLDFNYQLLSSRRTATDFLLGFDLTRFNIVEKKEQKQLMHFYAETGYVGIRQKFLYNHTLSSYVGFEAKAGLLRLGSKYDNLSGKSITLSLVWGFTGNRQAIQQAKALRYYDWDRKSGR